MTPKTKAESSEEFVEAMQKLENQSDTCYEGLELLNHEWNFSAWLSLTECSRQLEASITPNQYGGGQHKVTVMNLARVGAQMYRFARTASRPAMRAPSAFRWSPRVAKEAASAFQVAWEYSMFCVDFPAWHKNLYAADLVDASTIRFHSGSTELSRRVNAYQKGIRPAAFATKKDSETLPALAQSLQNSFDAVIQSSRKHGTYGLRLGPTGQLRSDMAAMYAARLSETFQRYPNISLGAYTLEQFRVFYAGLLAIAGAHEHLCFLWTRLHGQPLDVVTLVYPRLKWIKLISDLSGSTAGETEQMLPDLIFGDSPAQELQMMPFIPLARDNSLLALAPAFPLSSNWEENVLRVCSYVRPKTYSQTSLTKENEMRDQLKAATKLPRKASGPRNLAKGVPDLDLIIEDHPSGTIVLAELKWPRKPYAPREIPERDSEIRKGIAQIKAIKFFLEANPAFLADRKHITSSLSDYRHVHYCVVSRDHLIESQDQEIPVYPYDAFESEICGTKDMNSAIKFLNSMDWLPREGEDYTCQHAAGGVTIFSELFRLKSPSGPIITNH